MSMITGARQWVTLPNPPIIPLTPRPTQPPGRAPTRREPS